MQLQQSVKSPDKPRDDETTEKTENEKVKKANEEKAEQAEEEQLKKAEEEKVKKGDANEKGKLQKESDDLRKAKAAKLEEVDDKSSKDDVEVLGVSSADVVKANKEKALKRKEELQGQEQRAAKKVKMPN